MDSSVVCWAPGRGDYTGPTEESRDGAWPFRDGVGALRVAGPVLGRVLNEDGVAVPLCAAAPGAEGRAFGLLVLASCFFQGTPGRFLILGARFSLK